MTGRALLPFITIRIIPIRYQEIRLLTSYRITREFSDRFKDGGLTRYDPSQPMSSQFHQFTHDPLKASSIATNRLNCLLDYNDDYLFIGAEVIPGIFLNKKTFAFTYLNLWSKPFWFSPRAASDSTLPSSNWIHSIYKDRDGSYFMSLLSPGWVIHATGNRNEKLPIPLIRLRMHLPFRDFIRMETPSGAPRGTRDCICSMW